MRHIAFVVSGYPCARHPYSGSFVRQLVEAVAQEGVRCTVVHPHKLHEWLLDRFRPTACAVTTPDTVEVLRPPTLSLSNRRIGPFNTFKITHAAFQRSVWRALRGLSSLPDAVYGHFLYSAGATAVWAGRRLRRPGYVAVGEGTFWTLRPLGYERARRDLASMTGAVAVSSLLRRRLIAELGFAPDRVGVFPNGVDLRKFYPRDRQAMRRKHGLPEEKFLVIYVGNFIEPKGVRRAAEAIDGLPGIAGIFVGSGPLVPQIANLAFCGRVPHEQVPELLSAADCFVLPSDVEGSSNATLEAMACGLPVVVSDAAFNDDLVDGTNGLRVPPTEVTALLHAIRRLREDRALRNSLATRALERARSLGIDQRARGILGFLERMQLLSAGAVNAVPRTGEGRSTSLD